MKHYLITILISISLSLFISYYAIYYYEQSLIESLSYSAKDNNNIDVLNQKIEEAEKRIKYYGEFFKLVCYNCNLDTKINPETGSDLPIDVLAPYCNFLKDNIELNANIILDIQKEKI